MRTPNQRGWMSCIVVMGCGMLAMTGCGQPAHPRATESPRREAPPEHAAATAPVPAPAATSPAEAAQPSATEASPSAESSPAPNPTEATVAVKLPVVIPPELGWVAVVALDADAPGGWVTGDFDAERNKIEVRTRGVSRFAMDLSRVPIDWSHKVILAINGRNSELVKRDYNVYQVGRDDSGGWSVVE